jgi:NDP-sugar pyrophosphorylase family protein
MKAIILAGGKGERLRPFTIGIPKPMVEVGGKPILEHIIQLFKKSGISDLIFALCYRHKDISDYFGNGSKFNVKINYLIEDENNPLGTAGAIVGAKKFIEETFIVAYGDILRKLDIADVIKKHKVHNAFVTLVVYKNKRSNPKSLIKFDNYGVIHKFKERPKIIDKKEDFVWSNASFYIFQPGIFDFIIPGKIQDFGKDIFPKILSSGKIIYAYQQKGYFIDISNLEKLKEARRMFR